MRISDKAIKLTEFICASVITLTGVFLLLVSLGLFSFTFGDCWSVAVTTCFFVISLVTALIQKNSIGLTFAWAFGILALARLFVLLGLPEHSVYPAYIVALPIGIANGAVCGGYPSIISKVSLAITGAALILLLESTQVLPIAVVLSIIIVYFGVIGVLCSLFRLRNDKKSKEEENNNVS